MARLPQLQPANGRALIDYWSGFRVDGAVPEQVQIEPRRIKAILPDVFILDASNCEEPVYRLAGTHLCEIFGGELRGSPFLLNWNQGSQNTVRSLVHRSLGTADPVTLYASGLLTDGGSVNVHIVAAPLAFGNEGVVRLIGAVDVSGWSRFARGLISVLRFQEFDFVEWQHQPALVYSAKADTDSGVAATLPTRSGSAFG